MQQLTLNQNPLPNNGIVPVGIPPDTPLSLLVAHDFSLYTIQDLFLNYFANCNFRELQVQLETTQLQTLRIHNLSRWTSAMMMWCCRARKYERSQPEPMFVDYVCIDVMLHRARVWGFTSSTNVCGLKCVLSTTNSCGSLFLLCEFWVMVDVYNIFYCHVICLLIMWILGNDK
jgi:hypothetical protein